ncbi:hypothetical protein WQ57_14490 [Mesobacillus campisalis]|uniref:Uncharacterized protein n=1 Tax=Mesobacillus campisalis TaxID=1408103 RepID=A0A0M2STF7_9BACI|nr:hypothetical protein [Mesobacillus campisalis]KKK37408.1 hypothetical protein WQ57_14490 [Mesobacillus campisalis]
MKEVLQQVKEELERAYNEPESHSLEQSIKKLQSALEQNGDRGTMIENAITSIIQAQHAMQQLRNAGDVSSAAAFGEAHNALDQAIKSYSHVDNDPV